MIAGMVSCSNIQVTAQKAPNADLASLRTFEWQRPQPGGQANSIIDAQIEKSVQSDLGQIGVVPAPPGEHPDFLISYNTSVMNIITQRSAGSVGAGMGVSAPKGSQIQTSEQGTLALSFVDPKKPKRSGTQPRQQALIAQIGT